MHRQTYRSLAHHGMAWKCATGSATGWLWSVFGFFILSFAFAFNEAPPTSAIRKQRVEDQGHRMTDDGEKALTELWSS
jgi:hypothetical protein